eukprot:COSAG05_NODE_399_length_10267_cov_21.327301_6_plen_56_part_00
MRAAIAQIVIKEDSSYGSRYEGQMNQIGNAHGKGVVSWPNGARYVGEFEKGNFLG